MSSVGQVREMAIGYGVQGMSDQEMLALVLGCKQQNALDILSYFGGDIEQMAKASIRELMEVPGIGLALASRLKGAFALGKRMASSRLVGKKFTCSRDVFDAYGPRLSALHKEEFWVLFLNTRNVVTKEVQIAVGGIANCPVDPKEVFWEAVREKAVSIMLLHNHPSGDPAPSDEDQQLTERILQAGELLAIRVLDHIVIGGGDYVSFADRGLI